MHLHALPGFVFLFSPLIDLQEIRRHCVGFFAQAWDFFRESAADGVVEMVEVGAIAPRRRRPLLPSPLPPRQIGVVGSGGDNDEDGDDDDDAAAFGGSSERIIL